MNNKERMQYNTPLASRYASEEMLYIFSEDFKFSAWRQLWIALAEAEKQLGLPITKTQINELKKKRDDINYADAERFEKETRHDVMAHVKAYGKQCPKAAGIIHLGATSAYVGDNTDLIQLRAASQLTLLNLAKVIKQLSLFARKHAGTPALGYTHFQPAQPVTVGKRTCLWIQELLFDLKDLETFLKELKFLGVKGTTGTQASFLKLFNGSQEKVKKLDAIITRKMGFKEAYPVSGQTYSRKIDSKILSVLSGIAQTSHKFGSDVRLLQHLRELEEPFGRKQIGSSAMAYKRNPMRSERICSLARYVMSASNSTAFTAATQWFERTLDDSANKRIAIPESFLAIDAILKIFRNVAEGLVVNKPVLQKRLNDEVAFMATENILMEAVNRGADRQALHEEIRVLSMRARENITRGKPGKLLEEIAETPAFRLSLKEIRSLADPRAFTGLAREQTLEFLSAYVTPALRKYSNLNEKSGDLKV